MRFALHFSLDLLGPFGGHTNQQQTTMNILKTTIATAAALSCCIGIELPAKAERPGHKYVWTHAIYTFSQPGMTLGGDVTCSELLGSVSCSKSPSYTTAPSQYKRRLRVHVDCTDRTFDAKGDKQAWKSWDYAPNLYSTFVSACNNG